MLHRDYIAQSCPGSWGEAQCIRMVSDMFLTASSLYIENLEAGGADEGQMNMVAENCGGAVTVADVPASYGKAKDFFTRCANAFYDLFQQTQIKSDPRFLKIMVMSVLCSDSDPRCRALESELFN